MDFKKILNEKWPYLYFVVLTIIIFSDFIFSNKMLFGSDTMEAGIFFRSFYADFVKSYGRIPMWNPFIFGGMPFVDAMHGDTFFPVAFIQFIMPLYKALGYKLVMAVLMSGIFTYLYLRKMNFKLWPATFGATAYMVSGFMISLVYAGHDGRMYVSGLLPLLLYTYEIGFQRKSIFWFWPFAVSFGLLILANHPQFAYFAMWCVGAYIIMRSIVLLKESGFSAIIKPTVGLVAAMIIGLGLGLIQVWSTQDYVRNYSPRSEEGKGYEYASSWSLHAEEVFSQVVPGFSGMSTLPDHPPLDKTQTYWGKNYFKINSENAGLIVIILGLIGLFLNRDKFSYFFAGIALFSLLYALGDSGLIFKLFYYVMPFVSKFRAPSTIMFLFAFSFAYLAAKTIQYIGEENKISKFKNIFKWLLIFAGVYLLFAILISIAGDSLMSIYTSIFYGDMAQDKMVIMVQNIDNIAIGLLIGAFLMGAIAVILWGFNSKKISFTVVVLAFMVLVLLDSWIMDGKKFVRTVDHKPYFSAPDGVPFLNSQTKPFRTFLLPRTMSNQNSLAMFGHQQITGYHGNQLKWYNDFLGANYQNLIKYPSWLNLTNTKYLVARQNINHPSFVPVYNGTAGLVVYENKDVLPRFRLIYSYELIESLEAAMDKLKNPQFDYASNLILHSDPGMEISPPDSLSANSLTVLDTDPDQIMFKADLDTPALVAIQDNWYPFWKAYDKGVEIPVIRADYTFMAVVLGAGEHEIKLKIENPKYVIASNVTIFSWIFIILLIIVHSFFIFKSNSGKKEN